MSIKLTEEEKLQKEEQKWLEKTQSKFQKLISSPYWDSISLTELQMSIIKHIMNTKNVKMLSPSIDERIVDHVIDSLNKKIYTAKENCK